MTTFVEQRTREIFQNASIDALRTPSVSEDSHEDEYNFVQHSLRSTLANLDGPPTDKQLNLGLDVLNDADLVQPGNESDDAYRVRITERVVAGLYARAMDTLLKQALEADNEAHFWRRLEHSEYNTAMYLVQTFPLRIQSLMSTLFDSLRHRNIPITLSTFRIDSIRRLFPTTNRPSELLIAAFPHLNIHRRFFSTSPLSLARDECRIKRKKLEALRDDRALRIGLLVSASHDLERALSIHSTSQLTQHVILLSLALSPSPQSQSLQPRLDQEFLIQLDESNKYHSQEIDTLRRPSRLVRIWPRLVIIPPTIYFVSRTLYRSRESIVEHFKEATVTVRVFWESWVLQPIRNILDTIRTGGDEGVRVISKDALRADMESLERMTIALGTEKLGYTPEQIESLRQQIQQGDLTPVLQVYENDIKSPIRSAVTGTLIRGLLIQVQKLKVDVDFALSGIDKLLRSQELTFGFVGVAPALAVVYLSFNWFVDFWRGGRGRGRFGGKSQRAKLWHSMRRIEKLLIVPPESKIISDKISVDYRPLIATYSGLRMQRLPEHERRSGIDITSDRQDPYAKKVPEISREFVRDQDGVDDDYSQLSPLINGLLLLTCNHLRTFAETHLKKASFREDFLEDVRSLEDGVLNAREKRRVVTRMWRSWSKALGWDNLGEL